MAVLLASYAIKEGSQTSAEQHNARVAILVALPQLKDNSRVSFAPWGTSQIMHPPNFVRLVVLVHTQTQREGLSALRARVVGLLQALPQQHVALVGRDGTRLMVRLNVHSALQAPFLQSKIRQHALFVLMAVGSSF